MKRTKQNNKPTAILTGDWHLRDDQPTCRTDDFQLTQWKKVDLIAQLQKEYNCPVWHSGDLFNHWKPSPKLIAQALIHLPEQFSTIYGNHDLPQHNIDLADKCGIAPLLAANRIKNLFHCHWGETPEHATIQIPQVGRFGVEILVWHVMTYQGSPPWPGCSDPKAAKLLRKYPQYDLILTGHNHKPFVEEHEERLLVNPGSIFRMSADQINHRPRVYFWYKETNTVEPYYLLIDENVISREHIDRIETRNDRIDAFISKLDDDWEANVSFEENLEEFKKANNVRKSVFQIIYNAIDP